jgi:hypothetical protein
MNLGKKAAIASTLTMFVAIFIIIFILFIFLVLVGLLSVNPLTTSQLDSKNVKVTESSNENLALAEIFLGFLNKEVDFNGNKIKIKDLADSDFVNREGTDEKSKKFNLLFADFKKENKFGEDILLKVCTLTSYNPQKNVFSGENQLGDFCNNLEDKSNIICVFIPGVKKNLVCLGGRT